MKIICSLSLLATGVILASSPVDSSPLYPIGDSWTQEKIVPPFQATSLDKLLPAVAKATSSNILVDTTKVVDARVAPYSERIRSIGELFDNTRLSLMAYVTNQSQLDYERSTPDTFIVWHQPDRKKLTSLCIESQKNWDEKSSPEATTATIQKLKEFFADTKGWKPEAQTIAERNERAKGVDATYNLDDLPLELREPLRVELVRQIIASNASLSYRRFVPDFWKDARVTLEAASQNVFDDEGQYLGTRQNPVINIKPSARNAGWMQIFPHSDKQGAFTSKQTLGAQGKAAAARFSRTHPNFVNEPPPYLRPDTPPVVPTLGTDIQSEALLRQKRVSFAVKSVSLTSFVAQLQKQSNVTLSVDGSLSPDLKVTGYTASAQEDTKATSSMPLASAMTSLARLFAAHWDKDGVGYVLRTDGMNELHLGLRQLGYKANYGWSAHGDAEREELDTHLADDIVGNVDIDKLRASQGNSFSELPEDIQKEVLNRVWEDGSGGLISTQERIEEALAQDLRFRFAPLPQQATLFYGAFGTHAVEPFIGNEAGLVAFSANDRVIARLFPALRADPISAEEQKRIEQNEAYWRGAEAWVKQQGQPQEDAP